MSYSPFSSWLSEKCRLRYTSDTCRTQATARWEESPPPRSLATRLGEKCGPVIGMNVRARRVAGSMLVAAVFLATAAHGQTLVAVDDAWAAFEGRMLQVEAIGVLENDKLDGDDLPPGFEAQLVLSVTHGFMDCATDVGFLELCPDGSFEYTPDPDFVGSDTFTYEVSNGSITSNVAKVTITVSGCEPIVAAGPPAVDGFRCWVEESYLAKLAELGYGSFQEGFESDAVWGAARTPGTQPLVTSHGIGWAPNNGISGITTSGGAARTGSWGFYESPHGDTSGGLTSPLRDGFVGTWTGSGSLSGVGGWVTSNTGGAKVQFVLDGTVIGFSDPTVTSGFKFFGVIDTTGFSEFEIFETEGVVGDQEFIFADDFTFGGGMCMREACTTTVIFPDGFELGNTTAWSAAVP